MITNAAKELVSARGLAPGRAGLVALGATVVALLLVLLPRYDQTKTKLIDVYGYQFATENFARGKWRVTEAEIAERLAATDKYSPFQLMYIDLGNGLWAFRKSPGYPLLTVFFQKVGQPRAANGLLLVLTAGVFYFALKAWRDEQYALTGVLLFLFTPVTLRAAYFSTMDTFASGALLMIAASLLLYGHQFAGTPAAWLALAAAGMSAGWSVVVRVHNLPILVLLVVFVWLTFRSSDGRGSAQRGRAGLAFLAGAAIPLTVLLVYNQVVFGRPLATGYGFDSPFQELFLWESNTLVEMRGWQLWHVEPTLQRFSATILQHLVLWLEPLLRGWPLLPLALAALILAAIQRRVSAVYWLCLLWLLATYALYAGIVYFGITYELSVPYFRGQGFFAVDRYLYPASLPIALLTASFLSTLRRDLAYFVLLAFVVAGIAAHGSFVL